MKATLLLIVSWAFDILLKEILLYGGVKMSYADKVFIDMCKDILENGTDTKGEKVRPIWEDTKEPAYTIKKFGVVNRVWQRPLPDCISPMRCSHSAMHATLSGANSPCMWEPVLFNQ